MTIDFPKFRKLLCHLRELLSGPCRIDYINGSDTFPPPLSKEEEQEVFAQLHAGSTEARETLIVHNLRLVVYIAKKFESSGLGLEDLISIGTIGLIKAVETFCPEKKIKLATYASRCIENEILMVLRKNAQLRGEISIDEPLYAEWDGNELLLSDILGKEEEVVSRTGDASRSGFRTGTAGTGDHADAVRALRRQGTHSERGRRSHWHFPVLHLPTGKEDHSQAPKKTGGGRPAPHPHRQQITRAAGHFALRLF